MSLKTPENIKITTLTQPIAGKLHHAHCSAIVVFPDNELFVVYYHAIVEAHRSQAIYGVRKKPTDTKWSEPFLVSKDTWQMEGNPVLWIAPDTGRLWLFYISSFGGWSTCTPRYKISDNKGQTWNKSKRLYWFISRVTKNPPILTSKGTYILPATIEFRDCVARFFLSKDQGKTWVQRGWVDVDPLFIPPEKKWGRLVDQPTIIERKDGSIFCLMRAYKPLGKMMTTESKDDGNTWSAAKPSLLPNPDGGFHMIQLKSGNIAIIYNHAPAPPLNLSERNPVSVALSEDEGRTWKYRQNLCEYHADPNATVEQKSLRSQNFQYPTIVQGSDGILHATWSNSHSETLNGVPTRVTDIQYTSFSEDWIKQQRYFDEAWL